MEGAYIPNSGHATILPLYHWPELYTTQNYIYIVFNPAILALSDNWQTDLLTNTDESKKHFKMEKSM